jgi:hypothetical protein
MKILLLLLTCISSLSIKGPTNYPEPDFVNVPMWYDATSATLKNFERLPVNHGARVSGMTSGESLIFFAGETSSVQFYADNTN